MSLKPPAHVEPIDLFLKLIEWPRPIVALPIRLDAAPDVELSCQALTHVEWVTAKRDVSTVRQRLVSLSVVDASGARVFRDAREVGHLGQRDFATLYEATLQALAWFSPQFGWIDQQAWIRRLHDGAREVGATASVIADSATVAIGWGGVFINEQPETYWGCARRELLDGHLLVYRACRKLTE